VTWKFHELVPHKPDSPSQKIAHDGLILRVLVGSGVHGTAVDGQDDIDEMGVCVEPPETVVGLDQFKHYTFRTQPEGMPSGAGDLDFVVYSLRRYLGLVAAGNPTTLLPLFVPDRHIGYINHAGRELRESDQHLLSKRAGARFKGYLNSQRRGLTGEKTGAHNAGRMHIVEKYGYDAKYAAHAVRLGVQGIELMLTGQISLPITSEWLTTIRGIRQGEMPFEDVLSMIDQIDDDLSGAIAISPLPDEPDREWINDFLYRTHQWYWDNKEKK
jgi:hypothetical protein